MDHRLPTSALDGKTAHRQLDKVLLQRTAGPYILVEFERWPLGVTGDSGGFAGTRRYRFVQVMPIGTPGEPVAPTIGTGTKT